MEPQRSPAAAAQTSSDHQAPDSPGALFSVGTLDAVQSQQSLAPQPDPEYTIIKPRNWGQLFRRAAIALVPCLLIGGVVYLTMQHGSNQTQLQSGNFGVIQLPLASFKQPNTPISSAAHLRINGELQVTGSLQVSSSLLLSPSTQPANPQTGQIYFDKISNRLSYYNGQAFTEVGGGDTTITNVLSGTGNGVRLQAASPGDAQVGSFNVSGTGIVGTLQTTIISSDGGTLYINPVGQVAQQVVAPGTPATAGTTELGTNSTLPVSIQNNALSNKITIGTVGGIARSISVYLDGGSSSKHIQVALYADDGDIPSRPSNRLAFSPSTAIVPNAWNTITIPDTTVDANGSYWLAFNTDDTTVGLRTLGGGTGCEWVPGFGNMFDPFSPFGPCFYGLTSYSMYLNYAMGVGVSGSISQSLVTVGPTGQTLFRNSQDSTNAFQIQNAAGNTTVLSVDSQNGRIGIGKTTPTYKLDIAAGDINLNNGRALRFAGMPAFTVSNTGSKTAVVNTAGGGIVSAQSDQFIIQDAGGTSQKLVVDASGAATFKNSNNSTTAFQIQNSAGSTTMLNVDTINSIVTITSLAVTGNITVGGHLITSGTAPAIAAGAAACTTPTVSVSGNDTSGVITITTGSGCAASGTLATLTFATTFAAAPHIVLTPGSATALTLGAYVNDATATTTDFAIGTNTTPANTTVYKWNYIVLQ
jgi:hypothetical protein